MSIIAAIPASLTLIALSQDAQVDGQIASAPVNNSHLVSMCHNRTSASPIRASGLWCVYQVDGGRHHVFLTLRPDTTENVWVSIGDNRDYRLPPGARVHVCAVGASSEFGEQPQWQHQHVRFRFNDQEHDQTSITFTRRCTHRELPAIDSTSQPISLSVFAAGSQRAAVYGFWSVPRNGGDGTVNFEPEPTIP